MSIRLLVQNKKMKRRAHGEGSLLRRKGCNLWYCQYYKDGKRIRVSSGTAVKQKALGVLRRLMGDSERGLIPINELKKITYGELRAGLLANYAEKGNATLYQTADGDESIGGLKALDAFFGFSEDNPGAILPRITTDSARKFAQQRQAGGFSNATINRSLSCLRRMLRIAHEDGRIQVVPKIRFLKEPSARKGFVEIAQFEKLLNALPKNLRPLVLFLYWCGVRLGEARSIEWPQVDLKNNLVRLEDEQTKTGEARIVPLPPVLIAILREMQPKTGRVFDDTNLRTEWAKASEAVGLGSRIKLKSESGFTWYQYVGLMVHDLRRSAVRNLVNAGVPERVAMKISGHKTRSVFDRYHIVSAEDVSAAMTKLVSSARSHRKRQRRSRVGANLVQSDHRRTRKLLRARSSNG